MGVGGGGAGLRSWASGFQNPFSMASNVQGFFRSQGWLSEVLPKLQSAPVLMPVVVASRYKSAVIRVERALKLESLFVTLPRESKP